MVRQFGTLRTGIKKVFLLTVSVVMLTFQNCGNPDIPDYECTSDITIFIPDLADSIFFFKEGTYWIYQREDSLYEDSVWVSAEVVKNYPVDHKEYPEVKSKKCYEYRSVTLSSKEAYFFETTEFVVQRYEPINGTDYSKEIFFINENLTLSSGKSPLHRVIWIGDRLASDNGFGDTAVMLDTYFNNGIAYYTVLQLKKASPPAFKDYLVEGYYAERFGLIRFKDKHGAWWNVIRSHIVQ